MDDYLCGSVAKCGDENPIIMSIESVRAMFRKKNPEAFAAVEEMAKHPLTLEQMREQVRRGNPNGARYGNPKKANERTSQNRNPSPQ